MKFRLISRLTKHRNPIVHICDFSRCALNVRLYARIQHAATKATNTGYGLSLGASPLPAAIRISLLKIQSLCHDVFTSHPAYGNQNNIKDKFCNQNWIKESFKGVVIAVNIHPHNCSAAEVSPDYKLD